MLLKGFYTSFWVLGGAEKLRSVEGCEASGLRFWVVGFVRSLGFEASVL